MSKKDYRVRNWRDYNEALVNRGSITFWFDEEAIKKWHVKGEESRGRGRPKEYNDIAILCGLTLKAVFRLTFRSVEGFVSSIIKKLNLSIKAPDYTLLCKRQKNLNVSLPRKPLSPGEKLVILVDTSGLKVFGEGEWKVRQHGYVKHRLWRKLHLAINEKHEIESFELTELGVQDCEGFDLLIKNIDKEIDSAIGDGSYDRFRCYELAQENNFKLITPPQKNAATSYETRKKKKRVSKEALEKRDEAVMGVRKLGAKAWKEQTGYHRRSLAETAMFRMKTLIGNRLTTKLIANQKTETAIWCRALNKMTTLGMPRSQCCMV
jgi:hypothetical protein